MSGLPGSLVYIAFVRRIIPLIICIFFVDTLTELFFLGTKPQSYDNRTVEKTKRPLHRAEWFRSKLRAVDGLSEEFWLQHCH